MGILVGQKAPVFNATAVFEGEFKQISLQDYRDQHVILFFYPLDFTFVCPTELHAFQEKKAAFEKLNTTVLACSVDSHFSHKAWLETPKEKGGIQGVTYGLISDIGGKVARSYGVLNEEGIAYRGLFLIDKEGVVRSQTVNDLPLGRSVLETLRLVEALQHVENHGEVCPADWNKTDSAIRPTLESVGEYLKNR